MFRWIALIAAIVLVFAIAGVIVSYSSSTSSHQEQASEHSKESNLKEGDKTLWDSLFPDSISLYTLALVVFTAVLAFGALYQFSFLGRAERIAAETAKTAKDSVDVAKQALVAGQRAFISVSHRASAQKSIKDGKIYSYGFTPVWFNAGNTPTRNMENHINIRAFEKEIANDWDFPNLWDAKTPTEKRVPIRLGASPKNTVDGQSVTVSIDTIQDVIDGKKFLYFWGTATYNDVFPGTELHVTRFAVQIVIGGDPHDPEHLSISYPFLSKYNCSDEECSHLGFPADWKPRIMEVE
jgi:flagellar basal body-associated protein FliL